MNTGTLDEPSECWIRSFICNGYTARHVGNKPRKIPYLHSLKYPKERMVYTTLIVTPVVERRLGRETAQHFH